MNYIKKTPKQVANLVKSRNNWQFTYNGVYNGVEYYSYAPAYSCKIGLPQLYAFDGERAKAVDEADVMKVLRLLKNVDKLGVE